ncbi:MAG: GAF domain-containing sensor histidine kinase [Anaerolineae bacterium]|nr:GAF domain-containing sensor histidine kinase [Anaerolineae bacterium]MBT7072048.1 GAF domain-containing sensor histidine kinase [Anaerolineae bacterium]MBT7326672.1 GAF domain-containing sensor histidine kinase [Anaerolineae bacterium]
MLPLNSFIPLLVLFAFAFLVYASVIRATLQRHPGQERAAYLTGLYAFLALLLQGSETAWQIDFLPNLSAFAFEQIHWYSSLILSLLVLLILRTFLQKEHSYIWLGIGFLWVIALLLSALNLFQLPDILWTNGSWMLPRERLGFAIVSLGWLLFTLGAFFTFRHAYKNTRQPLHRNRLTYWIAIFVLLFSADALYINNLAIWSAPLRLLGTWLMSYVVITHHLPDLQQIMRSGLIYIATTLLASLFYIAGFSTAQAILPTFAEANPLLIGTILALLLATIFRTLFNFVETQVDRWLRIKHLDVSQTINEYSQSISNILDMERLANITVGLIMEVMDIQRGFLFLVDHTKEQNGTEYYSLRAIRSAGERPIKPISLDADSALAQYFLNEQRPLLQFDLDLLPVFKTSQPQERNRLNRLDAEVYVPIFAKREWIGLFALGSKLSGNRFTKENLTTLSALAGQTAVALENARLVENLIELNKKVHDAYRDLDNTKKDLEKIDRTKSDFISIASHELRTPLTVMRGYTEMLLDSPSLDENTLKMLKGIHDGTLRLHEIMDSLFDIAQIDARTLQLALEPIDVGKLIYEVGIGLSQAVKDRSQILRLDLPPLPGIQADPDTLRKVFYHLITNAIKFNPNEGQIVIRGKTLPFSQEDMPEGGLEIIISDTGIGIDPNFKEVIFTKFYQPGEQLNKHSTGKTKFKGSGAGLGLALSRGIIEAHGGKIWAESRGYDEENFPGSHFHVILPLRKQPKGSTLPFGETIRMTL